MIRVPSSGALATIVKAKSSGDLRATFCSSPVVSEASSMLSATAAIVTATASIADSTHSTVALIGAVATMIGASASLMNSVAGVTGVEAHGAREIVEIVGKPGDFDTGVRINIDGECLPVLDARERRRLDLRVIADVDSRVSVGDCLWDAPGPGGVYINGEPEDVYLRNQRLEVLDITVVGSGGFSTR